MAAHPRRRRALAAAILALVAAAPAGRVHASQSQPEKAQGPDNDAPLPTDDGASSNPLRRIAASFDFEEPDNPYPVPRHWLRAQDAEKSPRPGFPRFNQAEFDFRVAHSGKASVRLPVRGGSASLRLAPGVIPVFAEGDYAVGVWVRTEHLEHARAIVCARFLDQDSRPIATSEVRSSPLQTAGEWTEVSLQLIGAPPAAAFLQVEFQLLQPRQFESAEGPPGAAAFRVWREDLNAAAWFDDVVVYQLPRVEITTGAPANIVLMPDRPVVRILVRDFVGEHLDGHLVVTDADDRVIRDVQTPLAVAGRPQEWAPELPSFGWYHVTLSVLGDKPDGSRYRVGGAAMNFLWLGADPGAGPVLEGSRADRQRFGIIADRVETPLRSALPAVGRATGTGFMTIPLWGRNVTRAEVASSVPEIGKLIDQLSQAGQQVIVCVPSVPPEIHADGHADPNDPLSLASIDPSRWMGFLQPVLDRYGQRLTRWQIGRTGTDGAFWNPNLLASVDKMGTQLATLVPGPSVAVPWRGEYALPAGVPAPGADPEGGIGTLVMTFPAAFDSSTMREFVERLIARRRANSASTELVVVPELLPSDTYGERATTTELARRAVEFWAARTRPGNADLPVSLAISHPWERMGGVRSQLMPSASLGAFRTLIDHLSERVVVGEYKVTPGVKCYILADRSTGPNARVSGALVAWNESAGPGDVVMERYLGDGPIEAVDIFGNRSPVTRSGGAGGPHAVTIGQTPVFLEGADPMLASFCAQAHPEPAFLPSVQTEHELSLVLTNPWPQAISGKLQIDPPEVGSDAPTRRRWTVTPDGIIPFSLGAGQSKRIPWTLAFPFFEEMGEKQFSVVVRVTTDHELPPISLPMSIQVGLQDLGLEPDVQLGPRLDGPDVIISATVINRGDRSRMLKLEAVAPDTPTQQTVISDLPAGEAAIRRIVIKNGAARLSGARIYLSLSDSEEQQRLNTSVRVP